MGGYHTGYQHPPRKCKRLPNTATKEERAAAHHAKMILKGHRR